MHIAVHFHFNDEAKVAAITGVEGAVTDFILPCVGDSVLHRDEAGVPFRGRVTARAFTYDVPDGLNVAGSITVTLFLDRIFASQPKDLTKVEIVSGPVPPRIKASKPN